ncbi:hypothetical protein P4H27_31865 [Paenibacillus taichungensis]|uniref:hypothetical protein n=1 Tax=Paenibacillus taichungensis TaxID=484184 RepID=UPI002DC05F9C|nr:hypothetical protein [Paenibacillus taichungensis]MEC0111556.1 hypothetical protein [Paenibacillus taichungensis]MEC0199073.1 hypothetical protein [Paenibacillus taichungensis]
MNESKGRKTEEQREAKKKYDREYYQKRRENRTEEQHEAQKKYMRDYSKARRQGKKLKNEKDA